MSCRICHGLSTNELDNGIFAPPGRVRSSPILPQHLRDAAGAGCRCCRFLFDGLIDIVPEDELRAITDLYAISVVLNGERETLCLRTVSSNERETGLVFYARNTRVTDTFPLLTVASHISVDSSSSDCHQLASEWLRQCQLHHSCAKSNGGSNAVLPTRVIRVGGPNKPPRIYEPDSGTKGAYAALSYCWGKGRTFLTTSSSFSARQVGFELYEVPKTCRDAILVARALEIESLWIDQLCIIQDDADDWKREAGKMCSVYQNATVTLVALDSPSSDTGLFLASPGRRTAAIDVTMPDGSNEIVYARRDTSGGAQGIMHRVSGRLPGTADNVLTTRGWTLQEVMLSPRLLWFSSSEMAWACLNTTACECAPQLTSEWNEGSALGIMRPRQAIFFGVADRQDWEQFWQELVLEFSQRNFTVPADRFPALAGLATAFQNHVGDQYIGGLWRGQLVTQLLWASYPDQDLLDGNVAFSVQESLIADSGPSWSWCSAFKAAWFLSTASHRDFIQSWCVVSVEYESDATTLARGKITLEGHVLPLNFSGTCFLARGVGSTSPFADLDDFIPDRRPHYKGLNSLIGEDLYFLQGGYLRTKNKHGKLTGTDVCSGLVLQPIANDGTRTCFKRIGIIEAHLESTGAVGNWDAWRELCERTTAILV